MVVLVVEIGLGLGHIIQLQHALFVTPHAQRDSVIVGRHDFRCGHGLIQLVRTVFVPFELRRLAEHVLSEQAIQPGVVPGGRGYCSALFVHKRNPQLARRGNPEQPPAFPASSQVPTAFEHFQHDRLPVVREGYTAGQRIVICVRVDESRIGPRHTRRLQVALAACFEIVHEVLAAVSPV